MPIPPEIIDQLMKHHRKPEEMTGEQGIPEQLKKALLERAMQGGRTSLGTPSTPPSRLAWI